MNLKSIDLIIIKLIILLIEKSIELLIKILIESFFAFEEFVVN